MASLKPHSNKAHDLGDSTTKWGTLHSEQIKTETLTASSHVEIQGNLTVTGSQIVAEVTTVEAKDPLISLAKDNTADTFDIGFYGKSVNGSSETKYHGIVRDADDSGKFKVFRDASAEPGTTVGSHSPATVVADLEVPVGSSLKLPKSDDSLADYVTGVELGTAAANKVLTVDGSKDVSGIATLTAQTLSAGNITLNGNEISVSGGGSAKFTTIDVDGGAIDGTPIGATTASTAKFTTLEASGATTLNGAVTLGESQTDDINVEGKLASHILVKDDSTYDLGTNDDRLRHVYSDQITASTITATQVDINGGAIDGATIAASNITVGTSKTLDVSEGTLTTSAAQKLAILQGANSNVDVGDFDLRAKTLTADDLTSTRIVFAGTDGVLSDNENLTFATDTLTVAKIGAFQAAGNINFDNKEMTNVNIDSGTIQNTTISASNVTVGDGKTLDVSQGTITFAAGQIANVSLANDSVSFGGVSLDLGESDATPAFDLVDATNYPTSSLVGTITNTQLAGSIEDSKLNTITTGNKVSGSAVQLATDSAIENNSGLQLKTNIAGDGLLISETGTNQILSVGVDDNSIEISSNSLQIKQSGVTNEMLNGSIANDKLVNPKVTIIAGSGLKTGGEVSLGSSVTVDVDVDDSSIEVASDALQIKGLGVTNAMLAGSIENAKLINSTVSFGGVSLALGGSDATPAFNLSDATNYPTSSLTGTITNAQLAGSIENSKLQNSTISGIALGSDLNSLTVDDSSIKLSSGTTYNGSTGLTISVKDGGITNAMLDGSIVNDKLVNSTVSFGGVQLALGASDATPAFDLTDATNYPTSSLTGTITNAQLAGSIENDKLSNDTVSFGGVSVELGASDATPAFDLTDATNYPTSSLTGTITNAQLAGSIANDKLANSSLTVTAGDGLSGGGSIALGGNATLDVKVDDSSIETNSDTLRVKANGITNAMLGGSITDDKLNAITTADKVELSALKLSGETDVVTELADADLFIVSDAGSSNANSKMSASVLKSYITAGAVQGGTGVTYDTSTGQVSIGQEVATNSNVTFGQVTIGTNAVISETDAEKIDGITNGTAAANKALVLDANSKITSGLESITATEITDGTVKVTGGEITTSSDDLFLNAAGSNIKVAENKTLVVQSNLDVQGSIAGGDSGITFEGALFYKNSTSLSSDDHIVFVSEDITLPRAKTGSSSTKGRELILINNSATDRTIKTYDSNSQDLFSSGSNIAGDTNNLPGRKSMRLISDGAAWYVVSLN